MRKYFFFILVLTLALSEKACALTLDELTQNTPLSDGFVGIVYDKKEGKTYLKINNIGEDFIYQTSLPSGLGSNDVGLDRGQLGSTRLAVFEHTGNKVFLRQKPVRYRANTDNPTEALAVDEAFASSILWGFPVVESNDNWVLVDASEFVLQDSHGIGRHLKNIKQGDSYQVDSSRSALDIAWSKSFPDNTALQSIITLVGSKPGNHVKSTVPDPHAITVKMHHSFIRLPDDGYTPRKFFPKSGYWTLKFKDYAQPINEDINQQYIARHRLQKKDPASDISDVIKPFIYYLDPGVPEPVKSALLDGARWWTEAFEALGYRNAYQVRMLPSDADPMDIRYNVIQWVHRSTRGWSYGSSVIDPRTGEIIKGHVTLGSLRVRQDYLIAQGLMAPFSDNEDDQALMDLALARIRQLAAHEVGHTLGLSHNFAASNYDRGSVMDYPHPQFELINDKIVAPNAYGVGLGPWDKAAITYGYKEFTSESDSEALQDLLAENDRKGLLFISDADARDPGSPHAHASLWDNGKDAVSELEAVMKIREKAISNFGEDNLKNGRKWSDLEEIFAPVYFFHRYQIGASAKWLGGLEYDYSVKNANNVPWQTVIAGEKQQHALSSMLKTLQPSFLNVGPRIESLLVPKATENRRTRESLKGNTGVSFDHLALASASAQHTIGLIFNKHRLARIAQQSASDTLIPSIRKITKQINETIINREYSGLNAKIHQKVVDLIYSNYMNLLLDKSTPSTVKAEIFAALLSETSYQKARLKKVAQSSDYYGFHAYQLSRLKNFREAKVKEKIILPSMPPGSPI